MNPTVQDSLTVSLMAQEGWVRELVRGLVSESDIDDVVQETWMAALHTKPPPSRLRGFLASVARRRVARLHRTRARRDAREAQVANTEALPSTVEMLSRLQIQRHLARLVGELEEPYRTAVLLRFYEGLSPREIAVRQRIPAATVRSRLHRGLDRIRQRLRAEKGPRWRSALLLAFPESAVEALAVSAPAALATGVFAMKKLVTGLVALAVATICYLVFEPSESIATIASTQETDREFGATGVPITKVAELTAARADQGREALPQQVADVVTFDCLITDLEGRPFPGVEVEIHAFDPRERKIGEVLASAGELRGDAFGQLAVPYAQRPFALLAESGYVTLRAPVVDDETPRDDLILVVAEAMSLSGWVIDQAGAPLNHVHITADVPLMLDGFPYPLERTLDPRPERVLSDADGRFALPHVPANRTAHLTFRKQGYRLLKLPVPIPGQDSMQVQLESLLDTRRHIRGRVIDLHGLPIAAAAVRLGYSQMVQTDQDGEFTLAWPKRKSPLVAVQRGRLPAAVVDIDPAIHSASDVITLTVGGPTLEISGKVRDADGKPVPGFLIVPHDPSGPTPMMVLEDMAAPVTDQVAIRGRECSARVVDDGSFVLRGLLERDYRLQVFDPDTLLVILTEPISAGSKEAAIVIPADAVIDTLEGIVVDRQGEPIAGVRVKLIMAMGAAGGLESKLVRTDADGYFTLERVSRKMTSLGIWGDGIIEKMVPVESLDRSDPIYIEVQRRAQIRIEPALGTAPGTTVHFEDSLGETLPIWTITSDYTMTTSVYSLDRGVSSVLSLAESASQMVWSRDGLEIGRKTIYVDPARDGITLLIPGK